MTTQELARFARQHEDREPEYAEIAAALDRLHRLESAPSMVGEVERRANKIARLEAAGFPKSQAERDIATLLDAVRALTQERDQAVTRARQAEVAEHQAKTVASVYWGDAVRAAQERDAAQKRAEADHDKLLRIAALYHGWANAGPPDGGPACGWTAPAALNKIGQVLGDPFVFDDEKDHPGAAGKMVEIARIDRPKEPPHIVIGPPVTQAEIDAASERGKEMLRELSEAPLPAWRVELEHLLARSMGYPKGEFRSARFDALQELDALRVVVESGTGKADVHRAVAQELGDYCAPCAYDCMELPTTVRNGQWICQRNSHRYPINKQAWLAAIDAAGNALIKESR